MDLTIYQNMLSLVFAKQTVDQHKNLFAAILRKVSINSLSIQIMGRLPTLVGALALGAVARSHPDLIILGHPTWRCLTYGSGLPPCWEVFGDLVKDIIRYSLYTRDRGHLVVSVPSEFWMNLTQREEILEIGREEYRGGSLQVEFGEEPQAILRRGTDV